MGGGSVPSALLTAGAKRAGKWLGILFALLLPLGLARAQPAPRIVAVGDLHGDYAAYRAILHAAGLINRRDRSVNL